MKKYFPIVIMVFLFLVFFGCAAQTGIDPKTLSAPDEKALYDLMVKRCEALNAKDLDIFNRIYLADSPDLEWIRKKGIPMWERNGMRYSIHSLKKISIVGNDAAANFILYGSNQWGTNFTKNVEVLYVKKDSQWKIASSGEK
jgi:hypothetical protein